MVEEEAKRTIVEQVGLWIQKTEKKARSDIFFTGFGEANTRFKSALQFFIDYVLTKMASKCFLWDMFLRNLYRSKRSFSSIKAFRPRKNTSLRFLWPVPMSIFKTVKSHVKNYRTEGKHDRHYLYIADILVTIVDATG